MLVIIQKMFVARRDVVAPAVRGYASVVESKKKKLVVVGTGWAGARFTKDIDPKKFDITVLSMRNHMIFTPLLPQTTTGTLEFRSVCEPITSIQPALANKGSGFIPAAVHDLDYNSKVVKCVSRPSDSTSNTDGKAKNNFFEIEYDYLVLAHGASPLTFGVPGVQENAFFLREMSDARAIRRQILRNLDAASIPTLSDKERKRLVHLVIVGGGPTGVEFAGELTDFVNRDVRKKHPQLADEFQITIVEAMSVLGTFDAALRDFAVSSLAKNKVRIVQAACKKVNATSVELSNGDLLDFATMVWSTGVGPSSLTKSLKFDKTVGNRIAIDNYLRVLVNSQPLPDVFSLGDAAATVGAPLPCLAAVADKQGAYLAALLNNKESSINTRFSDYTHVGSPFSYLHKGSMISLGKRNALVQFAKEYKMFDMTGFKAFVMWRSVYLSMLTSTHWKTRVLSQWLSTTIFGRDTSYIPNEEEDSKAKLDYENMLASLQQSKQKQN